MVYNRMDTSFFKNHLKTVISKAGERYHPELDVALPIAKSFSFLLRNEEFCHLLREETKKIEECINSILENRVFVQISILENRRTEISDYCIKIISILGENSACSSSPIDWSSVFKYLQEISSLFDIFLIESFVKENKIIDDKNKQEYESLLYRIRELNKSINILRISNEDAKLSNIPFFLIKGQAGMGKTHLLCDLLDKHISNKNKGIFLFGRDFIGKNFWEEVGSILKIKNRNILLRELNKKNKKGRSLFIIDALNETPNEIFWKSTIPLVVEEFKKYPNIAFVISIRSGFESIYLQDEIAKKFVMKVHYGFGNQTLIACQKFFKRYSIPAPETPIFNTNFSNPLFLFLFCKAFKKRDGKGKEIFRGHEGFSYIFEYYIDTINRMLSKKYVSIKTTPPNDIWNSIIKNMAKAMVANNSLFISEAELKNIITKAYPRSTCPNELIQELENNIIINRYPTGKDIIITIPFQKFSDHLIARYILQSYTGDRKDIKQIREFFSLESNMGNFIKQSYYSPSLIEALAIQIPEHFSGIELFEVLTYLNIPHDVILNSVIYRKPSAFSNNGQKIVDFINNKQLVQEFVDKIIAVSGVSNHPFNAYSIHNHLSKLRMSDRDAFLYPILNGYYSEDDNSIVNVFITWAKDFDFSTMAEQSIFLYSLICTWFLSSSNKYIRNSATETLTKIYKTRTTLFIKLLNEFIFIDDIYILERLMCVLYGIALINQNNKEALKGLADWLVKNIFSGKYPPTHILLRDYAKCVMDIAYQNKLITKAMLTKASPPYGTPFPKQIHTRKYLEDKKEDRIKKLSDQLSKGEWALWSSVMLGGDFARYIIGTNTGGMTWTNIPLKKRKIHPSRYEALFKEKLTSIELQKYEELSRGNITFGPKVGKISISKDLIAIKTFVETLSLPKRKYFKRFIWGHLNRGSFYKNCKETTLDLEIVQRYIYNRVFGLGYDAKKHGKFDNYSRSREPQTIERIGKKYQWIAYYEVLAIISDNFKLRPNNDWEKFPKYSGAMGIGARDFDPSICFINKENNITLFSGWENNTFNYILPNQENNKDWLKKRKDYPAHNKLIEGISDNNEKFIVLKGFYSWREDEDKNDYPKKSLYFLLNSYLLKEKDKKTFLSFLKNKNFMGRWMPENIETSEIFLGELPTSYTYHNSYYYKDCLWLEQKISSKEIVQIKHSSLDFLWSTRDQASSRVYLPTLDITKTLGLVHKNLDGVLYNSDTPVTFNLESKVNSSHVLVIKKTELMKFLKKKGYALVWTILGEKSVINGALSPYPSLGYTEINGVYCCGYNTPLSGKTRTSSKHLRI